MSKFQAQARKGSYAEPHYQVYQKERVLRFFWRWRWTCSTPHYSDLVSILEGGERWFGKKETLIMWGTPRKVKNNG